MGRVRKSIEPTYVKTGVDAVFKHPIKGKTVRIHLGHGPAAAKNLRDLNAIFLSPERWTNPPADNAFIRSAWLRHCTPSTDGKRGTPVNAHESKRIEELSEDLVDRDALIEVLVSELSDSEKKVRMQAKQIEQLLGRKIRTEPFPSLADALKEWLSRYTGRDADHIKNIGWVLGAFVKHVGGDTVCDRLEGREDEIEKWLRSLKAKAGTRQQYRRHILRFLKDSGLSIDACKISNPKKHEIRRDRGGIEWLEEKAAAKVALQLPQYWADFWRFQLLTGLRPTEQITLKRGDFRGSMLTLSPLKHLTLKHGPRTIRLPDAAFKIASRRLHACDIVFPHIPHAGWVNKGPALAVGPWTRELVFGQRYREALEKVAGAPFTPDARTARRTFASIQLRKGMDVEYLAKYMGTSPEVLREHYAAILPQEVRLKSVKV